MRQVLALGLPQAVLPPLARPAVDFLRQAGFRGGETDVLAQAAASAPYLVHLAMSSAFMWAANAATVIPSCDSVDGRCHIVVANLLATPHRALEGPARAAMFRQLWRDPNLVVVHDPLPPNPALSDEGAANHCRLTPAHAHCGWHLLVYSRASDLPRRDLPRVFPGRQSREASLAVARLGQLLPDRAFLARQHPRAIDAGAFHNDVVMVGTCDRLLVHEYALVEQDLVLQTLRHHLPTLRIFQQVIRRLLDDGFITRVIFQDLDQSMAGGGGPACLRLCLPLTPQEVTTLRPGIVLDEGKLQWLETWVDHYYRETLTPQDLADPTLLSETQQALEALTQGLELDALYPFQQARPSTPR